MSTKEVADRLVALLREGKFDQAQNELYAESAVSIEPEHASAMGMPLRTEGMAGIKEKGKHWSDSIENFYGGTVSEPVIAGNHFSVSMAFDVKYKEQERREDAEVAVFKVGDGKVVSEQFFY